MRIAWATIILLVFLVGTVLLQIFLSKRESKWPGLVLPAITFLYAIVLLLNMARFVSMAHPVLAALGVFLFGNIPTLILLAIYFACRSGRKKKRELDKMKINDL